MNNKQEHRREVEKTIKVTVTYKNIIYESKKQKITLNTIAEELGVEYRNFLQRLKDGTLYEDEIIKLERLLRKDREYLLDKY